jgi:perilipin-2
VYDAAKGFVHHVFSPMDTFSAVKDYGTEKARTYTGMGVNKANELLATRYGTVALSGFETTAALAEKYLDHYFPATEQELQGESGNFIYHMK